MAARGWKYEGFAQESRRAVVVVAGEQRGGVPGKPSAHPPCCALPAGTGEEGLGVLFFPSHGDAALVRALWEGFG